MVHDDLRVEWIRQRVCVGFNLQESHCFDELLCREDGKDEELIISFLNIVSKEDRSLCLLFFKTVLEEEIEVKIPVSKLGLSFFFFVDIPTVQSSLEADFRHHQKKKILFKIKYFTSNNDLV